MITKHSSVYFLIDNHNQRIKFGKANVVLNRWRAFSYATINFNESRELICVDESAAFEIEGLLKKSFIRYKIPSKEIGNVDGKDEWYHLSISDRAIALIEFLQNDDDRMIEFNKGIKNPIQPLRINCIQSPKKTKEKREAEQAEKILFMEGINVQAIETCSTVLFNSHNFSSYIIKSQKITDHPFLESEFLVDIECFPPSKCDENYIEYIADALFQIEHNQIHTFPHNRYKIIQHVTIYRETADILHLRISLPLNIPNMKQTNSAVKNFINQIKKAA